MTINDGTDHAHKEECVKAATEAGVKGAALGLGISAPLVAAANHFSPTFRMFSVSTKTGLVVSPFFLMFFLRSELAMNACAQRRAQFHESNIITPK